MASTGVLAPDELSRKFNTVSIHTHELQSPVSEETSSSSSRAGPYYGRLSSLYHALDPAIISQLELAIVYGELRAFDKASEIFEKLPNEFNRDPVIAIEHAQVLWRQWSLHDCRDVLQLALDWNRQNAADFNDPGIHTLLRVFLGKVVVFTKGDFTQARDSMLEIRAWLTEVPVSEYSDLEVRGGMDGYQMTLCADPIPDTMSCTLLLPHVLCR